MFQCYGGLGAALLSAGAALLVSMLIPSVFWTLLISFVLLGLGVLLLRKK